MGIQGIIYGDSIYHITLDLSLLLTLLQGQIRSNVYIFYLKNYA